MTNQKHNEFEDRAIKRVLDLINRLAVIINGKKHLPDSKYIEIEKELLIGIQNEIREAIREAREDERRKLKKILREGFDVNIEEAIFEELENLNKS